MSLFHKYSFYKLVPPGCYSSLVLQYFLENSKSLWFFNIEFNTDNDENLVLPGQVILNSIQTFHSKANKSSFMTVLEQIMLK